MSDPERLTERTLAALIRRHGGHVSVTSEELFARDFDLVWLTERSPINENRRQRALPDKFHVEIENEEVNADEYEFAKSQILGVLSMMRLLSEPEERLKWTPMQRFQAFLLDIARGDLKFDAQQVTEAFMGSQPF